MIKVYTRTVADLETYIVYGTIYLTFTNFNLKVVTFTNFNLKVVFIYEKTSE